MLDAIINTILGSFVIFILYKTIDIFKEDLGKGLLYHLNLLHKSVGVWGGFNLTLFFWAYKLVPKFLSLEEFNEGKNNLYNYIDKSFIVCLTLTILIRVIISILEFYKSKKENNTSPKLKLLFSLLKDSVYLIILLIYIIVL